jgi:hypothetical protein
MGSAQNWGVDLGTCFRLRRMVEPFVDCKAVPTADSQQVLDGGPKMQHALGWVGRGRHDVRWYGMEPLFGQITPGEGCFLDAL